MIELARENQDTGSIGKDVSDHAGWQEGGWKGKSKAFGLALCQCRRRRAKKSEIS